MTKRRTVQILMAMLVLGLTTSARADDPGVPVQQDKVDMGTAMTLDQAAAAQAGIGATLGVMLGVASAMQAPLPYQIIHNKPIAEPIPTPTPPPIDSDGRPPSPKPTVPQDPFDPPGSQLPPTPPLPRPGIIHNGFLDPGTGKPMGPPINPPPYVPPSPLRPTHRTDPDFDPPDLG